MCIHNSLCPFSFTSKKGIGPVSDMSGCLPVQRSWDNGQRQWDKRFFFFFKVSFKKKILFIYLRLCWVFVSVWGLSLVVASGGHSSSRCAGPSLSRPLLLWSTGSRRADSVVVAHGPSCSAACGIFPDQGSNPCPLHWQADSQPLRHQGSPKTKDFSWDNHRGKQCIWNYMPWRVSIRLVLKPNK